MKYVTQYSVKEKYLDGKTVFDTRWQNLLCHLFTFFMVSEYKKDTGMHWTSTTFVTDMFLNV